MGKHKHKSKSNKKHKKSKYKANSDSNDDSGDEGQEVIWTENVKNSPIKYDEIEEGSTSRKGNEIDDLFDLFNKTSQSNQTKNLAQEKERKQAQFNEQKIRYSRELNSYFKDDVNKRFIDDPDELERFHSKKNNPKDKESEEDEPKPDNQSSSKKTVSDSEMNALNAKIIKAEMLGNKELAQELKEKLKKLKEKKFDDDNERVVYVTKAKDKTSEDKLSVKELYLKTKNITAREEAMRFVASSSKIRSADDEYEDIRNKKKAKLDLIGFDRIRFTSSKNDEDHKCDWCIEKVAKHLLLKFSFELSHCFVSLTPYKPFIPNVCQIVSKGHSERRSLDADQESWRELRQVMRTLSSFFERCYRCTTIFMETVFMNKKRGQNLSSNHFVIECIPIKQDYDADAKIFFHKAILETGEEWSINRKLIKLEKNPITKKLPKGLAYFWVSIGPEFDGFAHVIEDEDYFDKNFGKDIIAGLYDVDLARSKTPKFENYDIQHQRVKDFRNKWSNFIE